MDIKKAALGFYFYFFFVFYMYMCCMYLYMNEIVVCVPMCMDMHMCIDTHIYTVSVYVSIHVGSHRVVMSIFLDHINTLIT